MALNDSQRLAVERIGQDVCVEAGPGSGKTRVLVERFRWLVNNGVSPDRILAFTFTEKAAAEIKSRLAKAFEDPELRSRVERAWVSTVHGFCARLLRDNAIEAGVDPDFRVIDELESVALLRESADRALEEIFAEQPDSTRELLASMEVSSAAGLRQPDLAQSLLDVYESIRTVGASLDDLEPREAAPDPRFALEALLRDIAALAARLPASSPSQRERLEKLRTWLAGARPVPTTPADAIRLLESFELKNVRAPHSDQAKEIRDVRIPALLSDYAALHYAPLRNVLIETVRHMDRLYRSRKRMRSGLDFSDLEEKTIELLHSSPEVCERARQSFEHILMDELQDTNPLQWRLVNLLRTPGCFFAVGDINQSIFGFRNATPEVFRAYRDGLASQSQVIDSLRQNYRSGPAILQTVNRIFDGIGGIEPHQLIARRAAEDGLGVELRVASAETSEEAVELEAGWVAGRILELSEQYGFGKMAVLLRSLNSFGPLQRVLEKRKVPFAITGGKSFFEMREVRDLVQYLRILDNPLDEIAMAGVLRSPLAGISDETILRLKLRGGLYESILRLRAGEIPAEDFERLLPFRRRLRAALDRRDYVSPDRLLIGVMDQADYESSSTPAGRAAIARFLQLVRASHVRHDDQSFSGLVDELDRRRQSETEIEVASDEALNAVRIMSVHRSKGLEFPVVFLPFLDRSANFTKPPVCFDASDGLAVKWRSPSGAGRIAEPAHTRFCEGLAAREREEENRLLYVALTRAEERLVLSYSMRKRLGPWASLVSGAGLAIAAPPQADALPETRASLAEPEVVDAPALVGQHDSVVTVTSLSLFESCPRRYYLGRYLGWQTGERFVPDPESDSEQSEHVEASEFGRQVHQVLAGIAPPGIEPAAIDLARRFQSSDLGSRAAKAQRIEREYEFVTAFDGIVVRGQIDLWFEESGESVLVDYKTDHIAPEGDSERLDAYTLQLRIYAIALERITGRLPARATLAFLRNGRYIDVDLSGESLEAAGGVVRRLAEAQQEMSFPLKEGQQCARCDFYRRSCPAGGATSLVRLPSSAAARS